MKWIVIGGICLAIGIFDYLLILGSAKLERMRERKDVD